MPYQSLALSFDIALAPAIFQKLMDTVLQGCAAILMTFWSVHQMKTATSTLKQVFTHLTTRGLREV